MGLRKIVAGVVALAMALIATGTAMSQDNGSFQAVATYQYHYVTIEHTGQTYRGGPIEGARMITRSSGGPFVVGASTVSECLVFSSSSEDGIHLEAPCRDADKAGQVFYTYAIRQAGDLAVGGGGAGRWELRGGTGTYEGITGSCSYQTDYLDDTFLAVVADCTWSRP